ncbi:MAG: DUF4465 domain-containing protein [Verrucomicrobia bacterium]|nr:DUF4465 domain-containing protein [Verrucomicrobiota bacterium]MBU1908689.1 DUF4465 domain-containing protein [Verrucomicrobiota bacterium]
MRKFLVRCLTAGSLAGLPGFAPALDVDFEDHPLPAQSFWNGADLSGGVTSRTAFFRNSYNPDYGSWSGFALSNVNDTNTAGWLNQYAVFSGTGVGGAGTYAVVYDDTYGEEADIITLSLPAWIRGFYVNNTTYAALTMRDGDIFSKKFGGATGDDPDWFLLTITGRDLDGQVVGITNHYLADYRFADNDLDYIQSAWQWVDLSGFGAAVKTLHFSLTSSDTGAWGMNTPAYFALDSLVFTYAPAAGQTNSTAIHKDDKRFVTWASGWTNYLVGAGCDPQWQNPSNALGPASGEAFDIVCLGDGGTITLTFDIPLADGPGPDFAVFENAFDDFFLELARVEVSSDGLIFFSFPNHSLTPDPVPFTSAEVQATNSAGLAGKYRQGFGAPFDLRELAGVSPDLDVMDVRWVRLVDIVGDGSCTDSFGNIIYDPYPTEGSAGFDLDAVGILNYRMDCEPAAVSPGDGRFECLAFTNYLYELQAVEQLGSEDWATVASVTGCNERVTLDDPGPPAPGRFYRLRRSLLP